MQCLILQHAYRVQCQSYCDTSIWLLLTQKNRLYTSLKLQMAQEHGELYSLQVAVRSEERSINCSASKDVNPWEAFALSTKRFVIQLCFSMSSEKYFSKCEIRASKCEHITIFISHSSVFCRERLPDCEFRWDFKSGKLSHCSLFISRSVNHNCSFLLKAVILSRSCRRWVSFPWREMFNWFILKKYRRDTPTESGKLHPQR